MKRKIIHVDRELCNGCGLCVTDCPEGALQIKDGKAVVSNESFCDGLGACIGTCPVGALTIEECNVEAYDEKSVIKTIIKQGPDVIASHLRHLKEHKQTKELNEALSVLQEMGVQVPLSERVSNGCPGSMMQSLGPSLPNTSSSQSATAASALHQWPIQLHLVNPDTPFFNDTDLVVAADCVPFSFSSFHERFLAGKNLVVFCPKLDHSHDVYVDKLAHILSAHTIPSVTVVHMEVPCCTGTLRILEEAVKQSGKTTVIKDYTISLDGRII